MRIYASRKYDFHLNIPKVAKYVSTDLFFVPEKTVDQTCCLTFEFENFRYLYALLSGSQPYVI